MDYAFAPHARRLALFTEAISMSIYLSQVTHDFIIALWVTK